jgi:hypothetical protein
MTDRLLIGLCVAALLGASHWWAYDHGHDTASLEWKAKWEEQAGQLADAQRQAEQIQRDEELRRQSAITQVTRNAQEQIDQARADADRAHAAADSLRDQAKRLAASAGKACSNTGAASTGRTATTTAMVLADVFGRADQAAGELAAAYDRARIAGQTCEQAYKALSSGEQKQ